MRLANIDSIEAANAFLATYLPSHNQRFAVTPAEAGDAHVPCPLDDTALARVCAIQYRRKLSKDLVVSFNRQPYIVQTGDAPRYALRGQTAIVVEYPDQHIELLYQAEVLPFKVFDEAKPVCPAVDDKTLNPRMDDVLAKRPQTSIQKPPPNHPWRKSYKQNIVPSVLP